MTTLMAILATFAAMAFNRVYLEYKFSKVFAMERDSPINLISLFYVMISSFVFALVCVIVLIFQLSEDQFVPVGACSFVIFASAVMGYIASKKNIRLYFRHYLQKVYYSNYSLQYLYMKSQRGIVKPTA